MPIFAYRAKDAKGNTVTGRVEAATAPAAARLLRERNLVVYKLGPQTPNPLTLLSGFLNRVTLSDLATFTRQLSTMITAGLPITDALVIIKTQSSRSLAPIVGQILAEVEGGSSLADAFAKHPKIFSPVYIALIRAGEKGGVLDEILARLADNLEKQRGFESSVKGAMIYPAIVIIGMVAVSAIMMLFVVPKLTSLYGELNAQLPLATRILIAVSNFATRFWWLVLGLLGVLVFGLVALARTPAGRLKIDQLKFKLPIMGNLMRQIILTEFTRTLGLLVGVGISIVEALKVVSQVSGNTVIAGAINRVAQQVEKGFPVAYALSLEPEVFPPLVSQMLSVGEETGKLDEVLGKVSAIFGQESEHQVKALTTAIEPLIMIVLGIGVGFLVIAIILPIYNLTSQF